MQFLHKAAYRIHGISKLLNGPMSLTSEKRDDYAFEARLTDNPDAVLTFIEWGAIVGTQFFKNAFTRTESIPLEEAVTAARTQARTVRSQKQSGVFAVFDCMRMIDPPDFKARRDFGEFSISLDDVDSELLKKEFAQAIEGILIACSLRLPVNADHRIEQAGSISSLRENDDANPIFLMKVRAGSVRFSTSSPVGAEAIQGVDALGRRIQKSDTLKRAAQLLLKSQASKVDNLEGFVAAWTALEMFTNSVFKSTYSPQWIGLLRSGAPGTAVKVIDRLTSVMKDKYRLNDKFAVMASILDAGAAGGDIGKFENALDLRNKLLHGDDIGGNDLPTDDVQKLLVKYLALHLNARP